MAGTFDIAALLTGFGLVLNFVGALLIFFFGAPPLRVTLTGQNLDVWSHTPPEPQRSNNVRMFRRHRLWSRSGLLLLAVGFMLQFVALMAKE